MKRSKGKVECDTSDTGKESPASNSGILDSEDAHPAHDSGNITEPKPQRAGVYFSEETPLMPPALLVCQLPRSRPKK
jgi:hypothetical protein